MGLARKNFQVFGVGHSLLPYWEGSGKGKAKRVTIPRLLRLGRGWQDHRPTNHLDYTFPPSPGFIPSRPIHVPVSVARMEGNLSLCIGPSAVLLVFVLRQTRYLGFRSSQLSGGRSEALLIPSIRQTVSFWTSLQLSAHKVCPGRPSTLDLMRKGGIERVAKLDVLDIDSDWSLSGCAHLQKSKNWWLVDVFKTDTPTSCWLPRQQILEGGFVGPLLTTFWRGKQVSQPFKSPVRQLLKSSDGSARRSLRGCVGFSKCAVAQLPPEL